MQLASALLGMVDPALSVLELLLEHPTKGWIMTMISYIAVGASGDDRSK